jgi:hypothetical protein
MEDHSGIVRRSEEMIVPGEVVSYLDMCREEGVNLQRGMNYRFRADSTVLLMSVRRGAPYADRVEEDGRVLIYEGHDQPASRGGPDPKSIDQPMRTPAGALTENGKFVEAAHEYREGRRSPELVRVYEKIRSGIWVFNGFFRLVDVGRKRRTAAGSSNSGWKLILTRPRRLMPGSPRWSRTV